MADERPSETISEAIVPPATQPAFLDRELDEARQARFFTSPQGRRYRRNWVIAGPLMVMAGLAFVAVLSLWVTTAVSPERTPGWVAPAAVLAGVGLIVGLAFYYDAHNNRNTWYALDFLDQAVTQAGEASKALAAAHDSPAEFAAFWRATHERLASYHHEAGSQLRSSYRLAQGTALAAFLLLIALGIAAAVARSGTQAAATAGVATVGAAFAAYIGRTFHATYDRSLGQRMMYFDEPLVAARLLAAERLLAEFTDGARRDEALLRMVEAAVGAGSVSRQESAGADPGS